MTSCAALVRFCALQALLQGLDAGRPRLMADVRRLMTEAERLTVSRVSCVYCNRQPGQTK